MNTKLLVDAIVRQTTVLIAELSTAAGIRAPLAHVADQVFLQLAKAIEAQGVGRKVAADMFGMAIRSYQKKMQRLEESQSVRNKTLWEAVLEFLSDGSKTRARVLERFRFDPEREVTAVLNDLVTSGFVYATGRGATLCYGLTSDEERRSVLDSGDRESIIGMMWLQVHLHEPLPEDELLSAFAEVPEQAQEGLDELLRDGRLRRDPDGQLRAENFLVPLGSEAGWEAAVFDHFRAMANAIAQKVKLGRSAAGERDRVGGGTVMFSVYPGHPRESEVYGLLRDVRVRVGALWEKVAAYNEQHVVPEDRASKVYFYFGQTVQSPFSDEEEVNS
jgi:hypothetical protein